MARTLRYGLPPWIARGIAPAAPRFAPLRRDLETDVVIVGGGVTGVACAYFFAREGIKTVLLDRARIGRGSTAASTAMIMHETDADLVELVERYGRRAARKIWGASRRAVTDLVATARRLHIQCRLEPQESIYYTTDAADLQRLQTEYRMRREFGLPARWLSSVRVRERLGFDCRGAIRSDGNAALDPYRLCLGLIRSAVREGAAIHEDTYVRAIKFDRRGVDIRAPKATIRAKKVIIATGYATREWKRLLGRFKMMETFAIGTPPLSGERRRALGLRGAPVMTWNTDRPYLYLRWTPDHRILIGGFDIPHRGGRVRPGLIPPRSAALMYELVKLYPELVGIQPEFAWEGLFATTADSLPFIGPHRHFPHHLFALGYGGNGMAFAFLAARLLLRRYKGEHTKDDELFGFARLE